MMMTSSCIKPSFYKNSNFTSSAPHTNSLQNYKRRRETSIDHEFNPIVEKSQPPAPVKRPRLCGTNSAAAAAPEGNWKWEVLKSMNRDKSVSISTQGYFGATIDQTSPNLQSQTACSILSLTIAYWLLTTQSNKKLSKFSASSAALMPSPPTLDSLLLQGAKTWLQMLRIPEVKALSKQDGLHEIDTALTYGGPILEDHHHHRHKLNPSCISQNLGRSKIHKEDSFTCYLDDQVVDECMSFDAIWPSVVEAAKTESKTYVVGWNGHFFVLHLTPGAHAIYIIDTLGHRFSPGCKKAYVLKLDSNTKICNKGSKNDCTTPSTAPDVAKLYLKKFLTGFIVQQAWRDYKNGILPHEKLLEKLQMDFHSIAI